MILHTFSASPSSSSFADCLAMARNADTILLLGDGVYAALEGSIALDQLAQSPATIVLLDTDAAAAGIPAGRIVQIDMDGFAALTEHYPRQLAWY